MMTTHTLTSSVLDDSMCGGTSGVFRKGAVQLIKVFERESGWVWGGMMESARVHEQKRSRGAVRLKGTQKRAF